MSDMEITFRQKSAWQKDDCINRNAGYKCPNESTLEAVVPGTSGRIRCCEDEKCKKMAAELARASVLR